MAGRLLDQRRVGHAERLEQLAIEIRLAVRDEVHDRHADVGRQHRGALGDEGATVIAADPCWPG